jgi:hypothetical protein
MTVSRCRKTIYMILSEGSPALLALLLCAAASRFMTSEHDAGAVRPHDPSTSSLEATTPLASSESSFTIGELPAGGGDSPDAPSELVIGRINGRMSPRTLVGRPSQTRDEGRAPDSGRALVVTAPVTRSVSRDEWPCDALDSVHHRRMLASRAGELSVPPPTFVPGFMEAV